MDWATSQRVSMEGKSIFIFLSSSMFFSYYLATLYRVLEVPGESMGSSQLASPWSKRDVEEELEGKGKEGRSCGELE